ncbi:hypothetical protein AGMMS49965_19210 [Bacteroidia bacterium]|nr:hypothetical protein AGMMS49965_19210 [Bacteroidia bacterium]
MGIAQCPSHLTTDLLEHTDRVFLDGYPANISLTELDGAIERYQLAEIRNAQPYLGWVVNSDKPNTVQTAYRILLASSKELLDKNQADMWDSGRTESAHSIAVHYAGKPLQPSAVYYWKVKTWDNHGVESPFSQVRSFSTAQSLDGATARYPLQISDEYPVNIKSLGEGHSLIDFGKDAWGQLKLTLFSDKENDTLTIHLGEHLQDGRVNRDPDGSIRYAQYQLPLLRGTHTYLLKMRTHPRHSIHVMPDYIGEVMPFRYCEIENCPTSEVGNIVRQTVHYPFDETASMFHSSDTVLNQIWELSKYAIKATSFTGRYIDGDRERTTYEREALISQLGQYCVDREFSIARHSHEILIDSPTWPTEWAMQSVWMAWNDYLYTGNTVSLQKEYAALKGKTLIGLKEKNGLISTRTGKQTALRDIVDWPHISSFRFMPCVLTTGDAPEKINLPMAKFQTGDAAEWKTGDFNDSDWAELKTTGAWEKQGFEKYDGYAWYRIHFRLLPKSASKESLVIDLGQIDDADETYLNGVLIGKTDKYDIHRKYILRSDDAAIRWGQENVLAIRVYDNRNDGGFMGLGNTGMGEIDGFVFTDYNAVVNAYHYLALRQMAQIADALGNQADHAEYLRLAQQMKKDYNRLFFAPKKGWYKDGISTDHASLHANMFPMAFGLAPEKYIPSILKYMHTRGMACSISGALILIEALYNNHDAAYALELLTSTSDRSWYNTIRIGSTLTLEAWDNKYKSDLDWNQSAGSSPANLIPRKLMGIEPIEPGFKKIRIKPQPASLRQAEIKVPSIRGDIHAAFDNQPGKRFVLNVKIPANSTAEVWLPKLSKYRLTVDNISQKGTVEGDFVKVAIGSGEHVFEIEK